MKILFTLTLLFSTLSCTTVTNEKARLDVLLRATYDLDCAKEYLDVYPVSEKNGENEKVTMFNVEGCKKRATYQQQDDGQWYKSSDDTTEI